jgi:hypothetical protein
MDRAALTALIVPDTAKESASQPLLLSKGGVLKAE